MGQNVGSKHHPNWVPNKPSQSAWILDIKREFSLFIWSYELKVALEEKMLFATNFCNEKMSFATKKCFLQLIFQLQMTFFTCKNWLQTIVFLLINLAMANLIS